MSEASIAYGEMKWLDTDFFLLFGVYCVGVVIVPKFAERTMLCWWHLRATPIQIASLRADI